MHVAWNLGGFHIVASVCIKFLDAHMLWLWGKVSFSGALLIWKMSKPWHGFVAILNGCSAMPMSKVCKVIHHYSENKAWQGTEIELDNGYNVWCLARNFPGMLRDRSWCLFFSFQGPMQWLVLQCRQVLLVDWTWRRQTMESGRIHQWLLGEVIHRNSFGTLLPQLEIEINWGWQVWRVGCIPSNLVNADSVFKISVQATWRWCRSNAILWRGPSSENAFHSSSQSVTDTLARKLCHAKETVCLCGWEEKPVVPKQEAHGGYFLFWSPFVANSPWWLSIACGHKPSVANSP